MNCCASVNLETLMTPMPWQLRGGVEIMKDRLHDMRGTKSRDYLETIGDKLWRIEGHLPNSPNFFTAKVFTVRYVTPTFLYEVLHLAFMYNCFK